MRLTGPMNLKIPDPPQLTMLLGPVSSTKLIPAATNSTLKKRPSPPAICLNSLNRHSAQSKRINPATSVACAEAWVFKNLQPTPPSDSMAVFPKLHHYSSESLSSTKIYLTH